MIKHLDRLADRSCWISGERVNALVAVDANGLAEIGFHGAQPVSRNSRIFVRPAGVLAIALRDRDGEEFPLVPASVDWRPYGVHTWTDVHGTTVHMTFVAGRRFLRIAASRASGEPLNLVLRFSLDSCFTGIRGERLWSQPDVRGGWLHMHCNDRIMFKNWVRQSGPYAGDFLIPEPWRRLLFSRPIRSGQATHNDLLPEYRELDVPLYDATTWVRMGGEAVVVESGNGEFMFVTPLAAGQKTGGEFFVEFSERQDAFEDPASLPLQAGAILGGYEQMESESPRFRLGEFSSLQQCLSTIPGIVHSATIRELGMTRASPGAYYWIWAWDNLVVGQEMFRWGEADTVSAMARFINTHRDAGEAIPARWTRSFLPLDTPPRGALEFLLLHLVSQLAGESGDTQAIVDVYPFAARLLRERCEGGAEDGLHPNMSFYPDDPVAFGRTEESVVALEAGAMYSFARLMENAAVRLSDDTTARLARLFAGRIGEHFLRRFWDDDRGFFCDAFDRTSGERNASFPLFTLLFLQTPLGLPLVRPVLRRCAGFLRSTLQTPRGVRMLPVWDIRRGGEVATSSWYPHWDLYFLKLLRRAGDGDGVIQWLRAAEEALVHLGYVPEYLQLDELPGPDGRDPWLCHGAASNLNCITGWYRAVLEGVYGLEFDPGGMTAIPLSLPLEQLEVRRLRHRRSSWHVKVQHSGPVLSQLRIDGVLQQGCTKMPAATHDGATHLLEMTYGTRPLTPHFSELINAEVLESEGNEKRARVLVRALGTMDIAAVGGPDAVLAVDGLRVPLAWDPAGTTGYAQLVLRGVHELTLTTTSR